MKAGMKASRNGTPLRSHRIRPEPRPGTDLERSPETSHEGVLIFDERTGRIVDANPCVTRLLGTSHEEILGKRLEEIALFADRRKSEHLAILSHELRNALAPVSNALMILRLAQESEGPVSSKARLLIERQVGHLTRLVDDLQEIAGTGSGRVRLQPGQVDLRSVVQRSVEAVMTAHANRRLQVSVALPSEPLLLNADAIRLEQVVVNLLSNAANYTNDGGRITVNLDVTNAWAELRVADNGIGIEPELLVEVFNLFTRSERARTHSSVGQGIGLNIVKQIVSLHGGTVVAHSAGPGTGSEFVVMLPLAAPGIASVFLIPRSDREMAGR
jgi:PAS domain S-box-containing protein